MAEKKTALIRIDDKEIEAPVDVPILQTALDHGISIPYFCYHADLGPDGNCRMCLVEVEKVRKLQISCMLYPTPGMIVHTQTPKVKAEQKAVLEFILVNHPLDCPICDKVGECMLQENYFRFSGEKSHFWDAYAKVRAPKLEHFSDRILYDAERCIKCARCTRFTSDVSKSYGLGLVNRSVYSIVEVAGEKYEDNYSDCVSDICPVGALTRKPFRFQARVYTLQQNESVCPLCSRGCNTFLEHKHNKLYRVMPRYNRVVNQSWMCNAGRDLDLYLGRARATKPMHLGQELAWEEALTRFAQILGSYQKQSTEKKACAIASSFGSDEDIQGFLDLFSKKLGASVYFKTDSRLNEEKYPADHLLLTSDKNPSRYTLEKTHGLKEIADDTDLGVIDLLVVWGEGLGNSLSLAKREELFAKAKTKVLLTPFVEEGMDKYDLVLPLRTFAEKTGTFTNIEGKKSSFQVALIAPHPSIQDDLALFTSTRWE